MIYYGSTMKDMHKTVRELVNTGKNILPLSIPNNVKPDGSATYFSDKNHKDLSETRWGL